jgi:hypothetical protein
MPDLLETYTFEQSVAPPYSYSEGDLGKTLLNQYAASDYGLWQANQQLRYVSGFGSYGREKMLSDLGPDIHPIGHMPHSERALLAGLALQGITDLWTPEDTMIARAATSIHDIGECTHEELKRLCGRVVDDIPQGHKNDKDRADEAKIRRTLYSLGFPRVPDHLVERIEALITHQEKSPIAQLQEATHEGGTLQIGLASGRLVLEAGGPVPGDKRLDQLQTMAKCVTAHTWKILEERYSRFRYTDMLLTWAEPHYKRIKAEL